MDRGARQAPVHGVLESGTRLKRLSRNAWSQLNSQETRRGLVTMAGPLRKMTDSFPGKDSASEKPGTLFTTTALPTSFPL